MKNVFWNLLYFLGLLLLFSGCGNFNLGRGNYPNSLKNKAQRHVAQQGFINTKNQIDNFEVEKRIVFSSDFEDLPVYDSLQSVDLADSLANQPQEPDHTPSKPQCDSEILENASSESKLINHEEPTVEEDKPLNNKIRIARNIALLTYLGCLLLVLIGGVILTAFVVPLSSIAVFVLVIKGLRELKYSKEYERGYGWAVILLLFSGCIILFTLFFFLGPFFTGYTLF